MWAVHMKVIAFVIWNNFSTKNAGEQECFGLVLIVNYAQGHLDSLKGWRDMCFDSMHLKYEWFLKKKFHCKGDRFLKDQEKSSPFQIFE